MTLIITVHTGNNANSNFAYKNFIMYCQFETNVFASKVDISIVAVANCFN